MCFGHSGRVFVRNGHPGAAGWDRAGWDRAGWDRTGWDRAGWDRREVRGGAYGGLVRGVRPFWDTRRG